MNLNELSECETIIMKAIWDSETDIQSSQLIEKLRESYGKDYQRTTVATFLMRLAGKGFIDTYRHGKFAYIRALKTKEQYRKYILMRDIDFWFGGDLPGTIQQLVQENEFTPEDKAAIQEALAAK